MAMENSDNYIEKLEEQFLELAAEAVMSASRQAMKSGRQMIVSSSTNSEIIEVLQNGDIRVLKKIDPPLSIATGTVIQIP
jgi:hypothetical protein